MTDADDLHEPGDDIEPDGGDYDDGDDRYDEYKDDLAMGRIWPDGSYREPPEPDWDAVEEQRLQWEHEQAAHGGKRCDCEPEPSPAEAWGPEPPGGYSDEPPF